MPAGAHATAEGAQRSRVRARRRVRFRRAHTRLNTALQSVLDDRVRTNTLPALVSAVYSAQADVGRISFRFLGCQRRLRARDDAGVYRLEGALVYHTVPAPLACGAKQRTGSALLAY